jgi:hypothetical protein
VALLLRFHANHTVENHAGFTAEQVATAMGYDNLAELIRQYSKTN